MKGVVFAILSGIGSLVEGAGPRLECLKGLDTSFPKDPSYKNATFYWNSRLVSPKPAAVVRPIDEGQVMKAVKCAALTTTVSVRSGGHSYEGCWQGIKDGVVVDLRNMKKITLNKKSKTVTVQAGALLGSVMAKLWDEDKALLPHGLQPTIGMGGMTLGGGYGLTSRNYGLLMDRVISMKMVNTKGELLTVSKNSNADLFFALRGAGGGSFGVVTEFTYSYVKHSEDMTVVRYNWNAAKNNFTTIVDRVMKYYDSKPPTGAGHYFNLSPGGSLELGITYSDNPSRHQKHIEDLERIIKPWNKKEVKKKNWIDAFFFFGGYAGMADTTSTIKTLRNTKPITSQFFYKSKSGFLWKRLDTKTIETLGSILIPPGAGIFVLIDLWGGNIPITKDTAFGNRNKLASVQIGATDPIGLPLQKKVYNALKPSFSGSYQNYIDTDEPDFMGLYYPGMKDRLMNVKTKHDSQNKFKFRFSIPVKKILSDETPKKKL